MFEAAVAGLSLGLAAGVAPGPLQTLVVTATLRRGFGAGWRIAVAPLLTDAVVVGASLAFLSFLDAAVLGTLGLVGAVLLVGLGLVEMLRAAETARVDEEDRSGGDVGDLAAGALVNLTNPHPWIFWAAAGGPLVVRLWREAPSAAFAFLAPFYLGLVGGKVGLAAVVAALRRRLSAAWRRRLAVVGGLLLVVGGLLLGFDAWRGGLSLG